MFLQAERPFKVSHKFLFVDMKLKVDGPMGWAPGITRGPAPGMEVDNKVRVVMNLTRIGDRFRLAALGTGRSLFPRMKAGVGVDLQDSLEQFRGTAASLQPTIFGGLEEEFNIESHCSRVLLHSSRKKSARRRGGSARQPSA